MRKNNRIGVLPSVIESESDTLAPVDPFRALQNLIETYHFEFTPQQGHKLLKDAFGHDEMGIVAQVLVGVWQYAVKGEDDALLCGPYIAKGCQEAKLVETCRESGFEEEVHIFVLSTEVP
jgi:hypothetical protein